MLMMLGLLVVVMYVCLYVAIGSSFFDVAFFFEISNGKGGSTVFQYVSVVSFAASALMYIFILSLLYIRLSKYDATKETECLFWKKIILLKPIVGAAAYYLCQYHLKVRRDSIGIAVKIIYFLGRMSVFIAVLSLVAIFLVEKPSEFFMLSFFCGIYLAVSFYFIFDPLIILHAWLGGKLVSDYGQYFSSVKSVFGYEQYYKKEILGQGGRS